MKYEKESHLYSLHTYVSLGRLVHNLQYIHLCRSSHLVLEINLQCYIMESGFKVKSHASLSQLFNLMVFIFFIKIRINVFQNHFLITRITNKQSKHDCRRHFTQSLTHRCMENAWIIPPKINKTHKRVAQIFQQELCSLSLAWMSSTATLNCPSPRSVWRWDTFSCLSLTKDTSFIFLSTSPHSSL